MTPLKNMTTEELMDEAVMLSNDLTGVLQELLKREIPSLSFDAFGRALIMLAENRGGILRKTVSGQIIEGERIVHQRAYPKAVGR